MLITLSGEIDIGIPTPKVADHFTHLLTIDNPAYINAERMGFSTFGLDRKLKLFRWTKPDTLSIPRGLWRELKEFAPGTEVRRHLTLLPRINFDKDVIRLRPYQEQALDEIFRLRSPQGMLIMPCGAGKTETALELVARLRQPTLWITHTRDLVQQVCDRAQARLGLTGDEIGVIGGGMHKIGTHLTVATVQTLYRMDMDELSARIGTVIVDECHRVVANPSTAQMFAEVLACIPAYYRYGVTASESRGDGLEGTTRWVLGPVISRITQEELEKAGNTVIPTVIPVPTVFQYEPASDEERINFSRLLGKLADFKPRNQQIASHIERDAKDGHSILVLAATIKALRAIMAELPAWIQTAIITGDTPPRARADRLEAVRTGKASVLFATYPLAKEGLDIPRLDRLILASPIKAESAVQQSVGRIMRPAEGKRDAIVYDFVDELVPTLKGQFYARRRVYKKLNLGGFGK